MASRHEGEAPHLLRVRCPQLVDGAFGGDRWRARPPASSASAPAGNSSTASARARRLIAAVPPSSAAKWRNFSMRPVKPIRAAWGLPSGMKVRYVSPVRGRGRRRTPDHLRQARSGRRHSPGRRHRSCSPWAGPRARVRGSGSIGSVAAKLIKIAAGCIHELGEQKTDREQMRPPGDLACEPCAPVGSRDRKSGSWRDFLPQQRFRVFDKAVEGLIRARHDGRPVEPPGQRHRAFVT